MLALPDKGLLHDYFFDAKTGKYVHWLDGQEQFKIPREAKFNSIVVPTIDTIRNEWIFEKLLEKGYHVLCTGDTGTGKSTSANQTQDLIDAKLDKRRKGVIGPPLGQTTPPIEILRQRLVDIQFCAAMGPPGGGRTKITQRYVRHFNLINFINFSDESLARVFATIVDWKLNQGFASAIKGMSQTLVDATIDIYNRISAELLPTPAKSHYTFNLRDLSKVFQGMLMASPDHTKEKDGMIRLWSHECMRVFYDRLIDNVDRTWFSNLIVDVIIFCSFSDPKSLTKPYVEWIDRSQQAKIMDDYLDDFNQMTTKPMSLVLFQAAVSHIA
eukprot:GSChrysophyteH1.ASY1.ANO1.2183.1 assembled CDS